MSGELYPTPQLEDSYAKPPVARAQHVDPSKMKPLPFAECLAWIGENVWGCALLRQKKNQITVDFWGRMKYTSTSRRFVCSSLSMNIETLQIRRNATVAVHAGQMTPLCSDGDLRSKIPQVPMNCRDYDRPLSDGRCHSFDRPRPNITYSKDSSHRRFERTAMLRS